MVRRANRSIPHMAIVEAAFDILINLAKYEHGRQLLCDNKDVVLSTLMDVMVIFREKSPAIFCRGSAILWALAHVDPMKKVRVTLPLRFTD